MIDQRFALGAFTPHPIPPQIATPGPPPPTKSPSQPLPPPPAPPPSPLPETPIPEPPPPPRVDVGRVVGKPEELPPPCPDHSPTAINQLPVSAFVITRQPRFSLQDRPLHERMVESGGSRGADCDGRILNLIPTPAPSRRVLGQGHRVTD